MGNLQVLDCTLRDGGYCNQWNFGKLNIGRIMDSLSDAGIDIIECGFLKEGSDADESMTIFSSPHEVNQFIPSSHQNMYVAMMNYGEYEVENLERHGEGVRLNGIRLVFHKKDIKGAIEAGRKIQEKGYLLFLQPMVSVSYTDEEFLALIGEANELMPYAFYIVDSFGAMKRKDMIRLFYMVEHNLSTDISIGFHSHNNMQLAFSNAQVLVDIRTKHNLIIDSCVYGMGRGAGNLNTEIFVEYLNDNIGSEYRVKPLLTVIDEVLDSFYQRNYWGFSLPNYLSAAHNTHPNYAGYLNDKHTLTVEEMNDIFDMMEDDKRVYYDRKYIEDLYLRYLSRGEALEGRKSEFVSLVKGKDVLLIAPGKSSTDESDRIARFSERKGVITVSINFDYSYCETDYIFISNLRRFKELDKEKYGKCIVTSNISADRIFLQTDYKELLNDHEMVQDNAGLMAVRFLMNCGVRKICLAGIDGYSHDASKNFGDSRLAFITRAAVLDEMNVGITSILNEYAKEIDIEFLTEQRYVRLEKNRYRSGVNYTATDRITDRRDEMKQTSVLGGVLQ